MGYKKNTGVLQPKYKLEFSTNLNEPEILWLLAYQKIPVVATGVHFSFHQSMSPMNNLKHCCG
jgi:hypothetical protein